MRELRGLRLFGFVLILALAACAPAATPIPTALPTAAAAPTSTPLRAVGAAPTAVVAVPTADTAVPPTATAAFVPANVPQLPPVRVDELGLVAAGKPFRFVGANAIYFGFYPEYGYSIDQAIRSARANGITVLRVYLGFGETTWGGKPFEAYDQALDIAAKNGVYVIATLTDCCCFGLDWSQTADAYYSKLPYCNLTSASELTAYKDFIKSVVLRQNTVNGKLYRDDTTILAWDVVNEPALQLFKDAEVQAWLGAVTAYLKTLDPQHLVTAGIDGNWDAYSAAGPAYTRLDVPGLDFYSFHYNIPRMYEVAGNLDSIRYRTQMFLSMGKPVVLEEFGVGSERAFPKGTGQNLRDNWLQAYKDQMDTAFSNGASGVMFWGWGVPETKSVPLWWNLEDHDVTETEFTALIRDYEIPPADFTPTSAQSVSTPKPRAAVAPPVRIPAFCTLIGRPKTTTIAPDALVDLRWGWDAKTEAQVDDFIESGIVTVTLDGNVITALRQFPVQKMDTTGLYEVVWSAEVGRLSPGSHTVTYDLTWKKQISDGRETYGPGSAIESQHDECEIMVK